MTKFHKFNYMRCMRTHSCRKVVEIGIMQYCGKELRTYMYM